MAVDHLTAARDAWERGYRILVLLANWILATNKVRTRIDVDGDFRDLLADPKKPIKDLGVDDIREQVLWDLVREYDQLMAHLPTVAAEMGIRLDRETIWQLGDWDSLCEVLEQVDVQRGTGLWRLTSLIQSATKRSTWKAADWRSRFAAPMEATAKVWRERFSQPAAISEPKGAYSIGDCKYEVDGTVIRLSDERDTVLSELVRLRAATTEELIEASGKSHAVQILHKIVAAHPVLKPYIQMPGARGRGGYSTTIVAR